jgi:hypothetical protein
VPKIGTGIFPRATALFLVESTKTVPRVPKKEVKRPAFHVLTSPDTLKVFGMETSGHDCCYPETTELTARMPKKRDALLMLSIL